MSKKVGIILVNYNGYKDTIECINSLRNISYSDYEVIIVDNASTDKSVSEIKRYLKENEILIESHINGGFSSGNNIGIKYALEHKADYCLLLNNDTIVEADFLNKLLEAFEETPNCGLTIGKILYEAKRDTIWYAGGEINWKTAKTTHMHYMETDDDKNEKIQIVSFATGCCMCLSRRMIETIGLLDEKYFMYEEDADYCFRIHNAGFDIVYTPYAKIYHKVSSSADKISGLSQFYIIRNKFYLVNKYYSGVKKCKVMLYSKLRFIYRIFKGEYSLRIYLKAILSYLKRETGKSEITL